MLNNESYEKEFRALMEAEINGTELAENNPPQEEVNTEEVNTEEVNTEEVNTEEVNTELKEGESPKEKEQEGVESESKDPENLELKTNKKEKLDPIENYRKQALDHQRGFTRVSKDFSEYRKKVEAEIAELKNQLKPQQNSEKEDDLFNDLYQDQPFKKEDVKLPKEIQDQLKEVELLKNKLARLEGLEAYNNNVKPELVRMGIDIDNYYSISNGKFNEDFKNFLILNEDMQKAFLSFSPRLMKLVINEYNSENTSTQDNTINKHPKGGSQKSFTAPESYGSYAEEFRALQEAEMKKNLK